MNKKGLTLIEMLIYIVLFSIVAILIGSQMKSMVSSFSGGKTISILQSDTRDVLAVLTRDICNTGYKRIMVSAGGVYKDSVIEGTFLADSSSFIHKEGNPGDTLIIYKAVLDKSGNFSKKDTIQYYLDSTALKRKTGNSTVTISENVHGLQFEYGVYKIDSVLLDETSFNASNWAVPFGLDEMKFNQKINLVSEANLRIIYDMTFSEDFKNDMDSMRWEIRYFPTAGVAGSVAFKAPKSELGLEIPVPQNSNAELVLRYWTNGSKDFTVNSFKLLLDNFGKYQWTSNPQTNRKKGVKAIKIEALTRSKNKGETTVETPISVGNVSISRSGPYNWRHYSEIVEIPNNGLF
ncbi:MAG: prepilin-type N-terminal cleavage/methylation domain-containing protein [Fibrobacter sp.]|nr:prepilin-type N-terminal cleavage/methylation domain-containing protein [Fibrobacter sp.]